MSGEIFILAGVMIGGLVVIYILLSRKLEQPKMESQAITEWLKSMQNSLLTNNQNINNTLQRSYRDLHERLEKATEVIGDLKKEAGAFSEVGRSMRELEEFLKSPKLRGNIGEQVLKDLITQMFPKSSFFIQYSFKSGNIVDAAIKTDAGILPIDSKFPMENYQRLVKAETETERKSYQAALIRDVRKHVRDIAIKYILPEEGTMDFALMYVPSESVYYEVVNQPEILEYAREQRVYPVSPTTLYAHLQTILLAFEGKKMETRSKEVMTLLRGVQKDYEKLSESLGILNRHLTNAYGQMGNTNQTMISLEQKLGAAKALGHSKEELVEIAE